jgi:hypothetical protein
VSTINKYLLLGDENNNIWSFFLASVSAETIIGATYYHLNDDDKYWCQDREERRKRMVLFSSFVSQQTFNFLQHFQESIHEREKKKKEGGGEKDVTPNYVFSLYFLYFLLVFLFYYFFYHIKNNQ